MRLLLDENTHLKLTDWFRHAGHDATRVPSGLKNGKVIELACQESRVLVTHDNDFVNPLLYPPAKHSGVILLRIHPPTLRKILTAFERLFTHLPAKEFNQKLVILEEQGYHLLS
ncbi:MAG: DUF5615 family PIN-like protein [Elusimicrobia bacterium]|nr:DUF5615 family PIN-like protein [Elusimicrobiota bacterium]